MTPSSTTVYTAPGRSTIAVQRAMRRPWMLLAVTLMLVTGNPALAHHGWNWAVDEQSELDGSIEAISMAPPHPTLRVKASDGVVWQIDLGNPRQTERSGFTADSAKIGDPIRILGNRTKERGKTHMKAVRITIDGRNYDMYPERIKSD
jgi:hypothetical protein